MRNIVTALFSLGLLNVALAQTLTKQNNEPVAGDVNARIEYDTTSAIPRNTGQNQTWNFTSLSAAGFSSTNTYTNSSSVSFGTLFPTATLAEDDGFGFYNFYRASTNQYEMLGNSDGTITSTFTNPMIIINSWPVSYGYSATDTFSSSISGGTLSGSSSGSFTTTATGTGTITLPGGLTYNNVIQLKLTNRNVTIIGTPPLALTFTSNVTTYKYFHPTQKFELLNVEYTIDNSIFGNDTSIIISVAKNITVGLTDRNFDASFSIFPNPAKNDFSVKLSNPTQESCTLKIFNATGSEVKNIDLGQNAIIRENVNISDLPRGIYLVKTSLGEKTSARRLIVD